MPIDIAMAIAIGRVSFGAISTVRGAMNHKEIIKSLDEVKADLEKLERKTDQLLVCDLVASFNALANIARESTPGSRTGRLVFAEERLLASTGLDPEEGIAGKKGAFWLARVHYGLAYLAHLREDNATTALHIAHVFIFSAREARKEIFPHFYQSVFGSVHDEIDAWHETERRKLEDEIEEFARSASEQHSDLPPWRRALTGLGPAGVVALFPIAIPTLVAALVAGALVMSDGKARELMAQILNSPFRTPAQRVEAFRTLKVAALTGEYETRIDEKVKALAADLRSGLVKQGSAEPEPPADG